MDKNTNNDDKYSEIEVLRYDVTAVDSQKAYYDVNMDKICLPSADSSITQEFGLEDPDSNPILTELILTHEKQHQTNHHKGISMSNYKELQKDEFKAILASSVALFTKLRECSSDSERDKILSAVGNDSLFGKLIDDLNKTGIDIKTKNPQELNKLLGVVKDSSYDYLFKTSPGYQKKWENIVARRIVKDGKNADLNSYYRTSSNSDLVIGGFDFSKLGDPKMEFPRNYRIEAAAKMLKQGGDPDKVANFLIEADGIPLDKTESLNLNGLSREQAAQVLQTAIVTSDLSLSVAEDVCLNRKSSYSFDYITKRLSENTAFYLDAKLDALEKSGVLSKKGNDNKFQRLMQEATQVEVDGQKWFEEYKSFLNIAKDPSKKEELEALQKRIEETQGQKVNLNDVVKNMEQFKLPLDGTSIDEVKDKKFQKDKEEQEFFEQYYKDTPEEVVSYKPSKFRIMNLEANTLQDMYGACLEPQNNNNSNIIHQVPPYDENGRSNGSLSGLRYITSNNNQKKYIISDEKIMKKIEDTLVKQGKIIYTNGETNISDNFYNSNFTLDDKSGNNNGAYLVPEDWILAYGRAKLTNELQNQKGNTFDPNKYPDMAEKDARFNAACDLADNKKAKSLDNNPLTKTQETSAKSSSTNSINSLVLANLQSFR